MQCVKCCSLKFSFLQFAAPLSEGHKELPINLYEIKKFLVCTGQIRHEEELHLCLTLLMDKEGRKLR